MWQTFVFICLNILKLSWSNTNFVPIVGVALSESGFHRDLVYDVHFDSLAGKDCEYALEQHFPAGVYVSVDQLNDLKRLRKLNSIYPTHVDVEAVAEKSMPFTVILKGFPRISDNMKLPIHYRYHEPSKESDFFDVELTPPQLYIKCFGGDDDELMYKELLLTPHIKHCLEVDKVTFTTTDERKPGMDCNWRAMKVEYQIKSSLIAKIPVGDAKSFPLVLWATIICSWVISLWTVFHTRAVPKNINEKLDQQRRVNKKKQQ